LDSEIKTTNKCELESKPLIIKNLEQKLETTLTINNQLVKLHGNADRIDGVGSITRIIDYKTGIAESKELKLEEWSTIQTDSTLAKSFQLLMYAWMYQKMNPAIIDNLVSGIITFRELSAGLKTVKINNNDLLNLSVLDKFQEQLEIILTEILNPSIEFKQTLDLDNCEYCTFKGICNR
jgi:CRISPR/Cas system-associated exonuclease Cas4 (RecB family)